MEDIIGLALVGLGRIGMVHLSNIMGNPRTVLKYVVDVNLEHAKKLATRYPGVKVTDNLQEALNDEKVKGVIICTPTATHSGIILKSLKAKKAVFCEKPISSDLIELDECYLEAKKSGVPLLCGYHRRLDPSFRRLRNLCRDGKIGQIQIVKTTSRDNPVPSIAYLKISGKIFHDCGSHDIDMLRYILGEDPVEVFCHASSFSSDIKKIEDWDTVLMSLKYPSGVIASVDLSRKATYGYDQRIEVLGSHGMLQANNQPTTTTVVATEEGIMNDVNSYSFPQRYEKTYQIELDHFVDVILGKEEPIVAHEDVRNVTIISSAIEESVEKGQKVVIDYSKYPMLENISTSEHEEITPKTKKAKKSKY